MQLRFYKDEEGWFLDNEDYINLGGTKADLQMVSGANTLLDALTTKIVDVGFLGMGQVAVRANPLEITLQVDTAPFVGAVTLMKLEQEGWYIQLTDGHLLWLCPVTEWVFNGEYPDFIYYKKL